MIFGRIFTVEAPNTIPASGRRFIKHEGYIKSGWGLVDYLRAAIGQQGFECVVVWGKPGTGKSNLARQLLYRLYGDWDKVLRYTITGIDEMLSVVDEWRTSPTTPKAIILDDISRVLSRQLWQENWRLYVAFSKALQVIRSLFNVIIVTVPDIKFVPEPILNMQTFEVHVTPNKRYFAYRMSKLPDAYKPRGGYTHKYLVEVREFRLEDEPQYVYERYSEKRKKMAFDAMKEVQEAMARQVMGSEREGSVKVEQDLKAEKVERRTYRLICVAKCGHTWTYKPVKQPANRVKCPRCGSMNDFLLASSAE